MIKEELTEQKKIKQLISISGHGLHLRVADFLKNHKKDLAAWDISISPYYVDSVTDKAREVDIIATRIFPPEAKIPLLRHRKRWKFYVRLGIECKYLTEPAVFWADDTQLNPQAVSITGWNLEKLKEEGLLEKHHYFLHGQRTALLSAVYNGNRGDEKRLSDALVSTVQGLSFRINAENAFNYPIIVTKGAGMYLQDETRVDRVLYHMDYAYRDPKSGEIKEKKYYVDIIEESVLPQLLEEIEETAVWMRGLEELSYRIRNNNGQQRQRASSRWR